MTLLTYDPDRHIQKIVLVGCGGTGSELARLLARILYHMQQNHLRAPTLYVYDHDLVEPDNLGRQLFAASDLGQPKSLVVARRLNQALGLDIHYSTQPFNEESAGHFSGHTTLMCGAVDNHEARRAIALVDRAVWIDAGNHTTSGQIAIGDSYDPKEVEYSLNNAERDSVKHLPNPALIFPELLQPEARPHKLDPLSCAQLVAAGQQHLLVNNMMAAISAQYVYKILHREPVQTFLSYVSTDPPSTKSIPVCADEIRSHMKEPDPALRQEHRQRATREANFTPGLDIDALDPLMRQLLLT